MLLHWKYVTKIHHAHSLECWSDTDYQRKHKTIYISIDTCTTVPKVSWPKGQIHWSKKFAHIYRKKKLFAPSVASTYFWWALYKKTYQKVCKLLPEMNAYVTYPLGNYSQIAIQILCSIRKSCASYSQITSPFVMLGHFICSSGLKAHSPCSLITHNVGILLVQISRIWTMERQKVSHLFCELDPWANPKVPSQWSRPPADPASTSQKQWECLWQSFGYRVHICKRYSTDMICTRGRKIAITWFSI